MQPLVPFARFLFALRRPTKEETARLLRSRGETPASFTIREATSADIPALAQLHVDTFNETHRLFGSGPTYEIREAQYREKFAKVDARWFCFVAQRPNGDLIGFAIGEPSDDARFAGELSKLYVRREYHRAGLGRRLVCHVVRRFLGQGISSMMLFSEAENPSIVFYEALGGDRLLSESGDFHGAYGWRDIQPLASTCPAD
jgi:ribosomal protein S18 acetylase RimI-like enzyme